MYDGIQTAKVKAQFHDIAAKALKQFLNDSINARLKSAIGSEVKAQPVPQVEDIDDVDANETKIVTSEEEIEGFNIVKAILRQKVEVNRIHSRDTQSYFGVLLDDNNRKPLCRLRFNTKQKYIGIFDDARNEEKFAISCVDEIFDYSEQLLKTISLYE